MTADPWSRYENGGPVPIPRPIQAPRPLPKATPQRPAVEWLKAPEVAAMMRVSKMTVYRLGHEGSIRAVRIGRQLRYDAASVANYLAGAWVEVEE